MKVYKGTDKNMRCRGGFQYELGKTVEDDGATRCGDKGFHSCVAPFDVLRYFRKNDGSRYFEAEADGKIDGLNKKGQDSKITSSKLTLKTEIGFAGLVKAQIEHTREMAKTGEDSGGDCSNLAGGDCSNLAGGNRSNLAGGESSLLVCRNGMVKGGINSVLVLTQWDLVDDKYVPAAVKAEIVDGERIKADTWYELQDGEFKEVEDHERCGKNCERKC